MRPTPSVLHLDLDAFFASVEQRDKPSLRGKPVVVGGIGGRGVVATASYEAREFGVRSAMPTAEARRRVPHAAYLGGRFDAYRQSSRIVMALLHELSPLVEPLSLDEAFVDLEAGGVDASDPGVVEALVDELRAELTRRTEGLHASVGVGSSKFMAKVASEAAKPDGRLIVLAGQELDVVSPLPVRAVPGVGPATMERLAKLGIATVADLQHASERELVRELGSSAGSSLHELAFARDDRPVQSTREVKSISVEDTFQVDVIDPAQLAGIVDRDAESVAARLRRAGLFARTITLKVRLGDFTTWTRSRTLDGATDSTERIRSVAHGLLSDLELREGVRLLGVGVANFTQAAQEELFWPDESPAPVIEQVVHTAPAMRRRFGLADQWIAGMDVEHDDHGRGWVWGAGHGIVTVRFESRLTGVGPVRSLAADDPRLRAVGPLPMTWAVAEPSFTDNQDADGRAVDAQSADNP
ncbi:DNA polymerase IV [Brooklawnia cerclae]|uniref:DNA polymerase IV n=2 Tax=Brooklawnia cerclae TaxID=349934 RepID=A0ABX0SCB3_9ACTN|nr:DNA polymerase IV [Brooklawnia cerclae]NIH56027.1 DNA polymerase-4 [Brooklawnia cerclae]